MNPELLQQLRDIQAAPTPPFWPPAPGWWLLAVLLLLVLFYLTRKMIRRLGLQRRRAVILRQLDRLQRQYQAHNDSRAFAADLAILLRRAALSRFPRHQVAGLAGSDWLRFLDSTSDHQQFSQGIGKALADAPYQAHADCNVGDLYQLARTWLRRNL